ncbi:MAG TPA: acyl-CoA dehydrogenase family protein, partial [Gemmatimonadales bacterium]|nr:acyl-CoA dehydrogenase family protein [Gemmatimonadales bacterium]
MFTEEHAMLRKSIRAFVEKEVTPHVAEWETAGQIPKTFWRRLGELGFLGLEFPPEYGGAGGDFLSSVVLGEEMARCRSGGVAFSVLVHTDMSSPWLTRYGSEAQKRKYLPGITRGETVCALGITEPGAGSDMAALTTRAVKTGNGYALTGSKIFITNGVYGDLYFIAARTGPGTADRRHDGISMFLVERGWPGFTVSRKLDKMGMRASDTAELAFHDCPVPTENLLGVEGRGFHQLAAGLQRERIMAAVLALSGAAQALEDTVAYIRERRAFDGPLSQKQVLRHRVAD